jgi:tyrosinase
MAACAEGGAHAWGHNGIGAVMQDVYASPADPVFFLVSSRLVVVKRAMLTT